MTRKKFVIPKDVKNQILDRIKNQGTPVSQLAEEHGINSRTIYSWLSKGVTSVPSIQEMGRLKKENQTLLEIIGKLTVKLSVLEKKEAGR